MRCFIIGARADGHAKVVLEVLRAAGAHEPVGFIDDDPGKKGLTINGVAVLGGMADLAALKTKHKIQGAIVAIGDNPRRRALGAQLTRSGV
ncbi:MAG: hypothetical protein IPH05_08025 [Flavobacteriales bacterium]|nr:hypothetical protein [Flavobacteriales bacterium]